MKKWRVRDLGKRGFIYLRHRWDKELKYWRLRWWQLVLLLLWSTAPLISGWLFPEYQGLWLFIQLPFLGFAYLGGGLFMSIFHGEWAFAFGFSFTIFLLTYLALVGWRWYREDKRSNP